MGTSWIDITGAPPPVANDASNGVMAAVLADIIGFIIWG